MRKNQKTNCVFILLFILIIILSSCSSGPETIPFPEKELNYSQPVSVPLQFSGEKKLKWDTVKKGGIHPVIKTLDITTLPAAKYDSSGFKSFSKTPEESKFDFQSLPEINFNLDQLPSQSLQLKTTILPPPAIKKTLPPAVQKGNSLSIFDFGPKQEMPASFVTSLMKDRNGLMWLGSREGLFRYDGERIQTILPAQGNLFITGMAEDEKGRIWFIDQQQLGMIDLSKGLVGYCNILKVANNNLSKIIKDKKGRIWISKTISKDVIIIDPETQTFKRLNKSTGLSDEGGGNDITEDNNGNIWITTPFAGANIINLEQGKIKYLKKVNGLANDTLRAITMGNDGKLWLGIVGGGTDAFDIKKGTIIHYNESQGLVKAFTGDMSCDSKGRVWIGKNLGVDILDPENNSTRFIDDNSGLSAKWVASCTMDNNDRMWVASIGGIQIIEQYGETVNPLGSTSIISLMEDTVGTIWVATQQGIRLIDPQKKLIRRLDKTNGLADNFIQAFMQFDHQVWVSTDGGIEIVDPVKKTIEHLGKKEGLINDTIYVILKDKTGSIWLTGPSNGIDLIDAPKQSILHTDVAGGLSDNNIVDVREDHEGLVWLAVNSRGVNVADPVTGTVKYLNNQPGLSDTCYKMMLVDKYGRIWIGTDKGLYIVDKKKNSITTITTKEGLASNRILSLLEYNGSILAGTSTKINLITPPSQADSGQYWRIEVLKGSGRLNREATQSWSTDAITKNGKYLWGDLGMTVINDIKPDTGNVATYVTGITIMNKPLSFERRYTLGDKDSLWAGDTVYSKGQTPINTGYADTKIFKWTDVAGPYNMPTNFTIPYNRNYLQLQFAQAHVSGQDITNYTYVLEGIDKAWSNITTNTYTENYLNLPSGKYIFKVSSKTNNGNWTQPASFSFTISPPWWQAWWAWLIYSLIGAGILRAYIIYRSRRLQREKKLLEEKVALRTKQLEQSIEDLKATQTQLIQSEKMASLGELTAGIAHEIQNPLNFVNNFSEVSVELAGELKEELNKIEIPFEQKNNMESIVDDIVQNQEKINFHGKRADSIVKSMLQHSRNTTGQKESVDINSLTEEYLRLSYHGLRAKDKTFNATMKTELDKNLPPVSLIPQDIGRVVLNLFTNAFYSVIQKKSLVLNGYDPTVTLITKKLSGKVEIRVKDNGMGIPSKVLDKIFQPFFTTKSTGQGTGLGLSLSYDIVKTHGGEIKVETKEGEGAEFIILLPL